jgi:hypothetical protein
VLLNIKALKEDARGDLKGLLLRIAIGLQRRDDLASARAASRQAMNRIAGLARLRRNPGVEYSLLEGPTKTLYVSSHALKV